MLRRLMRLQNNPKGSAWKHISWDTENQSGKTPWRRDSGDQPSLRSWLWIKLFFSILVFFHET